MDVCSCGFGSEIEIAYFLSPVCVLEDL